MAAGQGAEEYIELTDFSQGIASGWRLPNSPNAADGVAQINGTFGCIAAQGGGLEAAPRISYKISNANIRINSNEPSTESGFSKNIRVHDFQSAPAYYFENWGSNISDPPDGFAISTEHWSYHTIGATVVEGSVADTLTVGSTGYYRVPRGWFGVVYNPFLSRVGFTQIYESDLTQTTPNPTSRQWSVSSCQFVRTALTYQTRTLPAGSGRPSNIQIGPTDATQPGVMTPIFHTILPSKLNGLWKYAQSITAVYPNLNWPSTLSPFYLAYKNGALTESAIDGTVKAANFPVTRLYSHQQRALYTSLFTVSTITTQNFVNGNEPYGDIWNNTYQAPDYRQHSFSDDMLFFHDKNSVADYDPEFNYLQPDGRQSDMIGAMVSMNQSDLFAVRANRGGLIIRGDMLQPTVTTVPGVVSTGPYPHRPVVTPLGMMYGTPFGVFAWNGGDVSQTVSPLLESAFWLIPGTHERAVRSPLTSCGTFAFKYPFVYAPNNWIMDIRGGGWFRVYPTTDLSTDQTTGAAINIGHWAGGSTNHMWGMPLEITTSGRNANLAVVSFDHDLGAVNWSWKSQPLVKTINRFVKFRELNATVQGSGTFTVTLEGSDGATQTVTFSVNSNDRPVLVSLPLSIDAQDVVVTITSAGSTSTTNAPSLRRINFGYQTTRSI